MGGGEGKANFCIILKSLSASHILYKTCVYDTIWRPYFEYKGFQPLSLEEVIVVLANKLKCKCNEVVWVRITLGIVISGWEAAVKSQRERSLLAALYCPHPGFHISELKCLFEGGPRFS